ncbi:MAG TPA: phosphate ABC transporter substrate-binding protein PstS family protein [Isosphaeraceae bacterium]|jgi:phosphate transport system substrate-binding protein|nr:phosphate ABC transporter substrate-binding protein PstS family protein [Isosphaeraceae bacterium]
MRIPRVIVLTALAGLTGCGQSGTSSSGVGGAKPIQVDGSSTVFRISKAAQEGFAAQDDSIQVIVGNHGTGGGFGAYLRGEVDIVDASRAAKPEEEAEAKSKGLEWQRFLVGYDGITVVVNPKNDFVKSLSVAQLKTLWEPGSKATTWKDLDPSWPGRKIVLYCPDNDSGTFEFFTEAIVGKAKKQRQDVQASADDNTLVSGVAGEPDGLGYFGYAYFAANASRLRAVPIRKDDKAEPVLPSPETILSKSYAPLSRPLYIYVKKSALKRPEVAKFVRYYIVNGADLAKQGGYVAPTEADRTANAEALKGLGVP